MITQKKTVKSFENWLREEVEQTFGIKRNDDLPTLEKWINATYPLTEQELQILKSLQKNLRKELDLYNEDELKLFFISEILKMVNFKSEIYRAFTQRQMEFTAETIDKKQMTVKGIVELVVATGQQVPQKPFFFLQEFKQSLKRNNDPLGQLLIAMLGAQVQNNNQKPVFGCYVLGADWHFVVLEGSQYAASSGFDVTKPLEFEQIIRILKEEKANIERELNLS